MPSPTAGHTPTHPRTRCSFTQTLPVAHGVQRYPHTAFVNSCGCGTTTKLRRTLCRSHRPVVVVVVVVLPIKIRQAGQTGCPSSFYYYRYRACRDPLCPPSPRAFLSRGAAASGACRRCSPRQSPPPEKPAQRVTQQYHFFPPQKQHKNNKNKNKGC